MLKVTGKGKPYDTQDPRSKQWTTLVNVIYEEVGRPTGKFGLVRSTELLDNFFGEATGLPQVRSHTQPMRVEVANKIKVGDEIPNLHINRGLYSLPDIKAQLDVKPRMIGNRPTFFLTWLDDKEADDLDERLPNEVLAQIRPDLFLAATVENAQIRKPDEGVSATDITEGHGVKQRKTGRPKTVGVKVH